VTHPVDRLAPFVDGALDPSDRAVVDEHLRSCARCRHEVAVARAAREALRALPAPEAPDIAAQFSPDRVAELAEPTPVARSRWSKAAPLLAAAAVVALVALAIPRLGGSSGDTGVTAADAAAGADGARSDIPLRLELDGTDYDSASLEDAAASFAATQTGQAAGESADGISAEDQGAPAGEASAVAAPDQLRIAGPQRSARAVRCLERAFPGFPGEIVRIGQARFEGTPAFLGYVIEGPGAGTPADTASIWVAAVEDCSILSYSSASL